jgi:DNA replication protein DnaC
MPSTKGYVTHHDHNGPDQHDDMTTLAPPTHELERQLRTLSLSGMAQTLLARNQEAISHHLAYTEFLELLVSDEFVRRRDRLFTRRLKAARVPQLKTLESFDWSFNPQIPKALILDLGTVRFIPEHGGLLLLGPPGTGKSHIALSLTVAAIQAGYTAYYRSAFDLAQDLAEADATGTRPALIKKTDAHRSAGDRRPRHAAHAAECGRRPARNLHPPL